MDRNGSSKVHIEGGLFDEAVRSLVEAWCAEDQGHEPEESTRHRQRLVRQLADECGILEDQANKLVRQRALEMYEEWDEPED